VAQNGTGRRRGYADRSIDAFFPGTRGEQMEPSHAMRRDLVNIVLESLGEYGLTPLVLDMIKFLLKSAYEGLVLFDKDRKIQFMDKCSEKVFGLEPGTARNLEIKDLIPDEDIEGVLRTGIPKISIQEFKGQKRLILKLPIKKEGKVIGVLGRGVLHTFEEIENLNKEIGNLKARLAYYRGEVKQLNPARYTFNDVLGASEKFREAKELAIKAAATEVGVLLVGESGTGKELFAHSIHNASSRRNKPFIRINCPSIPFELAESELFGYEKGAFSGAKNEGKPGKFELAEGGTVFLDEVSSLPLSIQAKLLRVLQEKEIERLGGRNTIKLNFRLIAATNVNLRELVAVGRFRADLFYRLSGVPIGIPALRERTEDMDILVSFLLEQVNKRLDTGISRVADEALEIMMNYEWPGNIRELTNVLEQSVLSLQEGHTVIQSENLPSFVLGKNYALHGDICPLRNTLQDAERQAIKRALNVTGGNKRRAAKLLGIQRCVLYQKLKKYLPLEGCGV
jgi:transcriptional regulator with PAS, ATPase and Fis domain